MMQKVQGRAKVLTGITTKKTSVDLTKIKKQQIDQNSQKNPWRQTLEK